MATEDKKNSVKSVFFRVPYSMILKDSKHQEMRPCQKPYVGDCYQLPELTAG